MQLFTVYILRSELTDRFYVGFTENLDRCIQDHNRGKNPHTAKYAPWALKTAIQFSDRQQALDFEKYLKTASGRAFAKKRL